MSEQEWKRAKSWSVPLYPSYREFFVPFFLGHYTFFLGVHAFLISTLVAKLPAKEWWTLFPAEWSTGLALAVVSIALKTAFDMNWIRIPIGPKKINWKRAAAEDRNSKTGKIVTETVTQKPQQCDIELVESAQGMSLHIPPPGDRQCLAKNEGWRISSCRIDPPRNREWHRHGLPPRDMAPCDACRWRRGFPIGRRGHWSLTDIANLGMSPTGSKTNEFEVLQLRIRLSNGSERTFFAGRDANELNWISTLLRARLPEQ